MKKFYSLVEFSFIPTSYHTIHFVPTCHAYLKDDVKGRKIVKGVYKFFCLLALYPLYMVSSSFITENVLRSCCKKDTFRLWIRESFHCLKQNHFWFVDYSRWKSAIFCERLSEFLEDTFIDYRHYFYLELQKKTCQTTIIFDHEK